MEHVCRQAARLAFSRPRRASSSTLEGTDGGILAVTGSFSSSLSLITSSSTSSSAAPPSSCCCPGRCCCASAS
jgi:hypothetical protein